MPVDIGPALEASRRKMAEMEIWSVDQWMFYCLCENIKVAKEMQDRLISACDAYWLEKVRRMIEEDDSAIVDAEPLALPAPASDDQQPSPRQRKQRRPSDVKRFCERVGMDRNEVLRRCRDGSIRASQGNGPGCEWRISDDEIERYAREGPRGQAR